MVKRAIERLEYLCNTIPPLLLELDEAEFSRPRAPGKWSKKEIIGHLLDSATNNHRRLVCAQFQQSPQIGYDPDLWNKYNYHQLLDSRLLIGFWELYNRRLAALMQTVPAQMLMREVRPTPHKPNESVTLLFIIEDYVIHHEHHLRQVVTYD